MSQMIPLKIADMAVAACNEEIAKHLLEIGRLQGRVIALEAQLESEKAAHKAIRSLSFTTAVPSEDYEKLKAENERIRKAGDTMLLALWLGVDEYSKEQKEKAEEVWNAAKEGKQSV